MGSLKKHRKTQCYYYTFICLIANSFMELVVRLSDYKLDFSPIRMQIQIQVVLVIHYSTTFFLTWYQMINKYCICLYLTDRLLSIYRGVSYILQEFAMSLHA